MSSILELDIVKTCLTLPPDVGENSAPVRQTLASALCVLGMLFAFSFDDAIHVHDCGASHSGQVVHSHFAFHPNASIKYSHLFLDDYDPPAHYLDISWAPSHAPMVIPVLVSESIVLEAPVYLGTELSAEFSVPRGPPLVRSNFLRAPPFTPSA